MTLLDDLKDIEAFRLETDVDCNVDNVDSAVDIEKIASVVGDSEDVTQRKKAVEAGVRWTRQRDGLAANFLAWLLVYKVVLPLQILQAIVYTQDSKLVDICGTSHFESDSIRHLNLSERKGAIPKYEVKGEKPPILVDFLAVETNLKRHSNYTKGVARQERRQETNAAALAKKSEQDQTAELKVKVRGIIMGSMSAEEITHKILRVASKRTSPEVIDTLVQTCIDEKAYNRLYGNVGYKLIQQSPHWAELLQKKFANVFAESCEDLNTHQINISGTFFGHLLGLAAIDWAQAFYALSLNPEASTASNRIFLQATMQELQQEMGLANLATKLSGSGLVEATKAIFTGEFAAQFWEVTGFQDLANLVSLDDFSSS